MDNFRALIIHSSDDVSAPLTATLEGMGVPIVVTSEPSIALQRMRTTVFGALVLDDALPDGGSLEVYNGLDDLGDHRPVVVMVTVPRSALAAARQNASDKLEYVAVPQTESDTERLALRVRSRLMNASLAAEFGAEPHHTEHRQGFGAVLAGVGQQAVRPSVAIAALVILLGLLYLLQQFGDQAGPVG
ncbi:MAG: hypothetical protein M3506_06090 [Chloroflexota bacterium]|nr:hypothetical protein [Chloroflexota bacterium]